MTSDSVREIEAIDFQASLRPVHGCEWGGRRERRGKSESRSPAARPAWKLINCDFRLRFDRAPRNFLQRSRPDRRAREEAEEEEEEKVVVVMMVGDGGEKRRGSGGRNGDGTGTNGDRKLAR